MILCHNQCVSLTTGHNPRFFSKHDFQVNIKWFPFPPSGSSHWEASNCCRLLPSGKRGMIGEWLNISIWSPTSTPFTRWVLVCNFSSSSWEFLNALYPLCPHTVGISICVPRLPHYDSFCQMAHISLVALTVLWPYSL